MRDTHSFDKVYVAGYCWCCPSVKQELHRHDSVAQIFSLSAGFFENPEISVVFPLMKEMGADSNCPF